MFERRFLYAGKKHPANPCVFRLRSRAATALKDVGTGPTRKMLLIADSLVLAFHLLLVAAGLAGSKVLALAAGLVLGMHVSTAHNFLHLKDKTAGFRRYYLDLAAFNSTDWRLLHFLSHHLFTNTYNDFEVQSLYPLLDFNANKEKGFLHRHLSG